MRRLRSVQVLRGVAACGVVFHHAYGTVHHFGPSVIGAAGVDLFFVISGFIMATVATGRSPVGFLSDRIWRIYPMWILALVPWALVSHHEAPSVVSSIALWPIYGGAFHNPILSVGWTLCFEMLFYVSFAAALASRAWIPLGAFVLCAAASFTGAALFQYLGSPMIVEFLFGVAIARLPRSERLGPLFILAGVCAFAVAPYWFYNVYLGPAACDRVIQWGLPAAAIVYGAISLDRFVGKAFDIPVFLGNASYSIYLFHPLVAFSGEWVSGMLISIGLGSAIYWLIERKVLTIKSARSYGVTTTMTV